MELSIYNTRIFGVEYKVEYKGDAFKQSAEVVKINGSENFDNEIDRRVVAYIKERTQKFYEKQLRWKHWKK